MRLDLNALPTDISFLHQVVRELVESLETERERAEQLAHQLKNLQRRHFGRKSEQFNSDQLQLWLDALDEEQAAAELEKPAEVNSAARERRPPVRKPLPKHLPRTSEVHDLDEPACTECGHALHRIGEDVTEQLDYQQASFFVHRTV
ncbi:MAG: IS66 family transposase zinc-finger binding domain-containing protein, partial [Gammaproteobacteria bacterium]|nr:IS66 family transposase zinc-finger binding domain-containing protein [Gammaproteobacteria bacterium]